MKCTVYDDDYDEVATIIVNWNNKDTLNASGSGVQGAEEAKIVQDAEEKKIVTKEEKLQNIKGGNDLVTDSTEWLSKQTAKTCDDAVNFVKQANKKAPELGLTDCECDGLDTDSEWSVSCNSKHTSAQDGRLSFYVKKGTETKAAGIPGRSLPKTYEKKVFDGETYETGDINGVKSKIKEYFKGKGFSDKQYKCPSNIKEKEEVTCTDINNDKHILFFEKITSAKSEPKGVYNQRFSKTFDDAVYETKKGNRLTVGDKIVEFIKGKGIPEETAKYIFLSGCRPSSGPDRTCTDDYGNEYKFKFTNIQKE